MGQEFDVASYSRANGVKNLLTDLPWSVDDRARESEALELIAVVEAEAKERKKREREAKKAAKEAEKKDNDGDKAGS